MSDLPLPPADETEVKDGLRIYTLAAALLNMPAAQYGAHPVQMRAALAMIKDASEVLGKLLSGGHSKIAGRLAGAFRNIGRARMADEIVGAMQSAGYTLAETDPFTDSESAPSGARDLSPHINRLQTRQR
jgi:hypothetical protein